MTLIKTTTDALKKPAYAGDVGMNLPAAQDSCLIKGSKTVVWSEIEVELPMNVWGAIFARSRTNFGDDIVIVLPGAIDPGYRGRLGVVVYVPDDRSWWERLRSLLLWAIYGTPQRGDCIHIAKGDSLGQLVVIPSVTPYRLEVTERLSPSKRGKNGFGSSGA